MRDLTCPFIQHGASQPVTEAPVRAAAPAPFFSNKKSWSPVDWVPSPEKTGSSHGQRRRVCWKLAWKPRQWGLALSGEAGAVTSGH